MAVELERIRGGWENVPEGLFCKTDLKEKGLKPIGEPVAEVWNSYKWVKLYSIREVVKRKPATKKQLEALEKAKAKREANLTCIKCGMYQLEKDLEITPEGKKCINCIMDEQGEMKLKQMEEEGLALFTKCQQQDFLVVSVRSTDYEKGEMLDICIVNKQGQVLFNSALKPKTTLSAIYDYSWLERDDARTWAEAHEQVKALVSDKWVVCYNLEYVQRTIANTNHLWGMESFPMQADCMMEAYAKYKNYGQWVTLREASGGAPAGFAALDGAMQSLQVIKNVMEEIR